MTLADDPENPKPSKKLLQSMDALHALREAMEQRLVEAQKNAAAAAGVQAQLDPIVQAVSATMK